MTLWLLISLILFSGFIWLATVFRRSAEHSASVKIKFYSALCVFFLMAPVVYALLGSPQLRSQSEEERNKGAELRATTQQLISKLEAVLKKNPDDATGWRLAARAYTALGRPQQAITAYENLIRLEGESTDNLLGLADAQISNAEGKIQNNTHKLIDTVLKKNPNHPKALFYKGLSERERGNKKAAIALWESALKHAPEDTPWLPMLRQQLDEARKNQ